MSADKKYPTLRRRRYAIAGGQRPLTGADVEGDFQEFHAPSSQLLNSHLSGPSVIEGLSVSGEIGGNKITVAPGVAIDAYGQMIVLSSPPANPGEQKSYAHIGEVSSGGGGIEPAERVEVPVHVPLGAIAGKAVLVTIEHYEGIVDDGTPYDIKELQPWIRLRPADEFDGNSVVLAFVQVDANGNLATLAVGNSAYVRNVVTQAVGELQLVRPQQSGQQIDEATVATLGITEHGDLRIASVSGKVLLEENVIAQRDFECAGTIRGSLAENMVSSQHIVNGSVKTAELATAAVTAEKVAANAIGTLQLQNDAVTADKIKNGQVGSAELANASVLFEKLASSAVSAVLSRIAVHHKSIVFGNGANPPNDQQATKDYTFTLGSKVIGGWWSLQQDASGSDAFKQFDIGGTSGSDNNVPTISGNKITFRVHKSPGAGLIRVLFSIVYLN